jgi:conjugal transfer pilin signal peptidase TrbI
MGESRMTDASEIENKDNADIVPEDEKAVRRFPVWLTNPVTLGVSAMLAVIVTAWLTVKVTTPVVVTFDMKGTMDLFIQQTLAQKVPEAQSKALMVRFNRAMTDSLQAWQGSHNVVILVAPAVVSSQPDITQEVRNDIAVRMQEVGQ